MCKHSHQVDIKTYEDKTMNLIKIFALSFVLLTIFFQNSSVDAKKSKKKSKKTSKINNVIAQPRPQPTTDEPPRTTTQGVDDSTDVEYVSPFFQKLLHHYHSLR